MTLKLFKIKLKKKNIKPVQAALKIVFALSLNFGLINTHRNKRLITR